MHHVVARWQRLVDVSDPLPLLPYFQIVTICYKLALSFPPFYLQNCAIKHPTLLPNHTPKQPYDIILNRALVLYLSASSASAIARLTLHSPIHFPAGTLFLTPTLKLFIRID
jgi:hypothetical protein